MKIESKTLNLQFEDWKFSGDTFSPSNIQVHDSAATNQKSYNCKQHRRSNRASMLKLKHIGPNLGTFEEKVDHDREDSSKSCNGNPELDVEHISEGGQWDRFLWLGHEQVVVVGKEWHREVQNLFHEK